MPELPEVETIKNNLINLIKDLRINKIDVLYNGTILGDKEEFVNAITGKQIKDITRIGKFMIFHLSENVCFISHLRMEGKYYKLDENEPNSSHARVVFHLNDNSKLCYDDSRCFGIMKLTNEINYKNEKEIAKLGPEPFDIKDSNYLYEKAKNKSIPIKTFLLDQTIMTGLGNIYVDETLFESKMHPLVAPKTLKKSEWSNILNNSVQILKKAIQQGGSTIRSYHPGKGIDGNFQVSLKAYGKIGENCPNCGHPFRKIFVGGRGTTFCPICQKYHGKDLKVAICGPISVGKSTVLETFKENNFDVLSTDEIVHQLYKQKDIANKIANMFNLTFKDEVNIDELRSYLILHPEAKKKLERYVHPLVKAKVELFLKKSLTRIKVVEVPLLFEAKMEELFDYIILLTSTKAKAMLEKRNKDSAHDLAIINSSYNYDKYKKEADVVIYNDKDIASLKSNINKLINKDLLMRLD